MSQSSHCGGGNQCNPKPLLPSATGYQIRSNTQAQCVSIQPVRAFCANRVRRLKCNTGALLECFFAFWKQTKAKMRNQSLPQRAGTDLCPVPNLLVLVTNVYHLCAGTVANKHIHTKTSRLPSNCNFVQMDLAGPFGGSGVPSRIG